ncbi:hypothetical protein SH668x_000498 [Planctomicrobium sp. SH668]|uniref:hypothetical protein n=1 Tax=Planctomicrobium sp. SH668 TaxID=3448126 RepID=UPI003F5BEF13
MWQRSYHPGLDNWNGYVNGDGSSVFDDSTRSVSMQHPWMSGVPFFVPEAWAPTYDYPLVCYMHDDSRSEQDLWKWFPSISDQNYLAVGLRAPFPAQSQMPGQYRWRGQRPDATAAVLNDSVAAVEENWNVHAERIYLMGEGSGAVAALQQFLLNQLRSDEHEVDFAGVICHDLPAWWTRVIPQIADFGRGRVLLLNPAMDGDAGEVPAAIDAMSESGMNVTVAKNNQPAAELINNWLMTSISSAVF